MKDVSSCVNLNTKHFVAEYDMGRNGGYTHLTQLAMHFPFCP